jgi:hypothetical protein
MPGAASAEFKREAPEELPLLTSITFRPPALQGLRAGTPSSVPLGLPGTLPAFVLAALLAGRAGAATSPPATSSAPDATMNSSLASLQVGDDLYQEPIGHDAEGCMMYRLFSPTTLVTHAISYRSIEGGFTLKRRLALCTPGA